MLDLPSRTRSDAPRTEAVRCLLVGSDPHYLLNFRRELIEELISSKYEVTTVAWSRPPEVVASLNNLGVREHLELPINQSSLNLLHELKLLWALHQVIRSQRPDILICYTAKPVVNGMIAGWLLKVPQRAALVEGLGYAFTGGRGIRRLIARMLVSISYWISLRCATHVVVLNAADHTYISSRIGISTKKLSVVPGIGVPDSYFNANRKTEGSSQFRFVFVGRLLFDKGVRELLGAAKILRDRGINFQLTLYGAFDSNPTTLPRDEFDHLIQQAGAEWFGPTDNVIGALEKADALVLPSYREGFPRVVMEAMAAGVMPIVSDVPGCRDAVINGETGFIVSVRDELALADAMESVAQNPELALQLGQAAKHYASRHFRAKTQSRKLLSALNVRTSPSLAPA